MKKIIASVLLVILLLFTLVAVDDYNQPRTPVFIGGTEYLNLINTERAIRDLPPLNDSDTLEVAAETKCNDMVDRKYIDHQDPEGDYVWSDLEQDRKYGENIGIGYYSSYDTVQAWLNSPTHLENIVDTEFTEVAHYTCYAGDRYLTVQVFAGN